MATQFSSETVPLGQLFTNPISLEAPGYQRSFAWTPVEAGQLLEDITSAQEEDADYFLSFMLFIERSRSPSLIPAWARARPERVLEVVDGFQRLTSLTLLFCVLRDLDAEQGQPANARLLAAIGSGQGRAQRWRMSLRKAETAFFEAYARGPGATRNQPDEAQLSPAEMNIVVVRDHFMSELAGLDADARRHLADFLLDRCRIASVVTNDLDRAHQLFTILNGRGKPLDRKDILKASILGGVAGEALAGATAIWQDAEEKLGAEFEQLFSYIRAMYGRPGGQVISNVKEIAARRGGSVQFLEGLLSPAASVLLGLRLSERAEADYPAAVIQALQYLNRLSFSDWIPPAMLWCLERPNDSAGLAWFLGALDRLALGIRILGLGGKKRASWFAAVTGAIRNGSDLRAPDSPLNFTRQDLRAMHYNLRTLHARDASCAKYLLMRLSDHIAGIPQSLSFPGDMSVEHVLPRKLSNNSQWRGWFPDFAEREVYTESLGNLMLVTKSQNDRAGNQDLARKLEIYFKTPSAPLPAINESVRGLQEWKAPQIKAREAELMGLMESLWDFNFSSSPSEPVQAANVVPARSRRRA